MKLYTLTYLGRTYSYFKLMQISLFYGLYYFYHLPRPRHNDWPAFIRLSGKSATPLIQSDVMKVAGMEHSSRALFRIDNALSARTHKLDRKFHGHTSFK
jgi:hypothetical protein